MADLTREQLCQAILRKLPMVAFLPDAAEMAHVISYNGLASVIVPGSKARTFAQVYAEVFGQRLDGRALRKRRGAA